MSVRDKPAAMISNDGFVAQTEYTVAARKNVGQSTAFVGITLHMTWQLDNICSTWKWNCFAGHISCFRGCIGVFLLRYAVIVYRNVIVSCFSRSIPLMGPLAQW